jgi:iron complex transport system ATP-binding protein
VLHDLRLAAHYCHRLLLLNQGRALADGLPEEVLNESDVGQAFGIRMRKGMGLMTDSFSLPWERI